MKILAIETSCDETACAIVEDGQNLIAASLATSRDMHLKTGGVVPEVAARKQAESVVPVIADCLQKAGISHEDASREIDAIAVTIGPGLIGSLVVGVAAAKALAIAWDKPLIPVNHLVGHIYANFIKTEQHDPNEITLPALAMVVSGGHTDLVLMHDHGKLEFIGGTVDDAAGEAFDKVARLLGISQYMGGPLLSKKASECTNNTLAGRLPRPKISDDDFDFSFSGLKSAVKRLVENEDHPVDVVSCEFEMAVVDVLVAKAVKAAQKYNTKSFLMGGGVAANVPLRTRLKNELAEIGVTLFVPPISLCTDNAVYIAGAAYFNNPKLTLDRALQVQADPSLEITD